ncbi:CHAT domain-containing protein [Streptomyces sp. NPDC046881]|uniref:CHAT domain-containing protein n=1 Tax=Streptomyces sp. NPDC046881 TaxID=3155374 RepID=UPI0033F7AAE7
MYTAGRGRLRMMIGCNDLLLPPVTWGYARPHFGTGGSRRNANRMRAPMVEVTTLVDNVLAATTPEAWRNAVQSFGPRLMNDPTLADAVLAHAAALERQGRRSDGQTLRRWCDEVQRRITEQQVISSLLQADSIEQIDALLRQNPSMATPGTGEQILAEVRQIMGGDSPYPPNIAALVAGPMVRVGLRIATFIGRTDLRARFLLQRAMVATHMNDHGAALRDLEAAEALWRSIGNSCEAGRCMSMAGNALLGLERINDAIQRMLDAARLLEECGDDAMLGPTYDDVAGILAGRGDVEGTLKYLELSVHHRIAAGQAQKALSLLQMAAPMWTQRRDTGRALQYAERLVDLCTRGPSGLEPPERAKLVEVIRDLAVSTTVHAHSEIEFMGGAADTTIGYQAFIAPEQLAMARRWYAVLEQAQPLAPSEENAAVLNYLDALLCLSEGEHDRAVCQAEAALRFYDGRGDRDQSLGMVSLLSQAEFARGHPASAVAWCDDALARLDARGTNDRDDRAMILMHRGHDLLTLGRPQSALDDLKEAVRLSQDGADRMARTIEGATQGVLGLVYEFLGDVPAALEAGAKALRCARMLGHLRGEASQLLALGTLVGKLATGWLKTKLSPADTNLLGQVALEADPSMASEPPGQSLEGIAVALLNRAARLCEEIHDEVQWTKAKLNLSNLLPDSEDKVEILTEMVAHKETVGDRLGKAVALANLGAAHSALGHRKQAVRALEGSLAISRPAGYFESAAQAARDLADLHQRQGEVRAAEVSYHEAVEMIEAARTQVPLDDRARVGFVRNKGRAYTSLVDLLVDRGAHNEALEMVQRAKSRALLELAGTSGLQPTVTLRGHAADLLVEEDRCLVRLRGTPEPDAAATLAQLNAVYDELSNFDPEYVAMRRGTPATVLELRNWLAAQQQPVLLVEYFLSGNWLTLFLLRAEWDDVRVSRVPCTPEELSTGYEDFLRQVVHYRNAAGAGWTRLGQLLTAPLAQYLCPGDLVYLVPHRRLHSLPLHALPVESQPLIIDHPVAYAPASGLLPLASNPAKGTGRLESCASFGVVFEEEARQVAAVFGTKIIDPTSVQPDAVEELCTGKDVCHFSCHGFFNAMYPMSSGLILQQDHDSSRAQLEHRMAPPDPGGLLTARQVMDMRLQSELVCVSACESASSEIGEGDELLGLARAFLHAGASSLVASLWAVDADSTRELMVAFYQHLQDQYARDGTIDKAGALRHAQLRLIDEVGVRSSFYWSPFVLIGDWR